MEMGTAGVALWFVLLIPLNQGLKRTGIHAEGGTGRSLFC